MSWRKTNHRLRRLEAEAIYLMREAVADFANPVMLYSIGKDSAVMLRLAQKAFFPGRLPFPLLHVDTTWKFREMITFRDQFCRENNLDLKVWINPEGRAQNINPFDHGSKKHTDIMKTASLKQAQNSSNRSFSREYRCGWTTAITRPPVTARAAVSTEAILRPRIVPPEAARAS